ncbi:TetR/AcrR family transcriptional regulator [Alcaligenaceae bacterium]|nr:TetR/AcrR family transcriptional regulator [Alcaligenaceae bacterium]
MKPTSNTSVPDAGARQRRQYLPTEQRKKDLLDAALIEFSSHGYGAATIARIATRAGLSKAGLYAHYKSKDEIFEDLLISLLTPSFPVQTWLLKEGVPLPEAIDAFIEQSYARLEDPKFLAMFQLMLAESGRAPQLMQRWHEEVVQPYTDKTQQVIDECVVKGLMRASALTRHFALAISPVLMAAQWLLVFNKADTRAEVEKIRQTHHALLLELLVVET